jgi:type VI secretion system protein ImpE
MLAEEKLRAGQVEEALALLQDEVRKAPGNPKYRVFLFQLLSVLGRWDRALTQLKVAGDLDSQCLPMVQTYRELLRCEVLRAQVFAGQKTPVLFGEPQQWAALIVEALRLTAEDKHAEAETLRAQAFEAAPTTSGTIDGKRFEWIADGDVRLGPVLEVVIHGRYAWLPFHQIRAIRVEAPKDLRDMVWMPVVLTVATGAEMVAFVPTRYPGSESHADGIVRLARRTDWTEVPGGYVGIGQRVLATNDGDHALLDVREIDLDVEHGADETTAADG